MYFVFVIKTVKLWPKNRWPCSETVGLCPEIRCPMLTKIVWTILRKPCCPKYIPKNPFFYARKIRLRMPRNPLIYDQKTVDLWPENRWLSAWLWITVYILFFRPHALSQSTWKLEDCPSTIRITKQLEYRGGDHDHPPHTKIVWISHMSVQLLLYYHHGILARYGLHYSKRYMAMCLL